MQQWYNAQDWVSWGMMKNYLIIGLPLMQSLSTEQLTSVLAHEFGHLSKNHARAANWIYGNVFVGHSSICWLNKMPAELILYFVRFLSDLCLILQLIHFQLHERERVRSG